MSKPLFKRQEGAWVCYWNGVFGWGNSVEEAFDVLLRVCELLFVAPPKGRIDWRPGWFV